MNDPKTLRGYPLPHEDNLLIEDQPRLAEAISKIDADMTSAHQKGDSALSGVQTLAQNDEQISQELNSLAERLRTAETADQQNVKLTGNQTVAGVKTFSASPSVPTPAANDNSGKAANTEFVAAAVSSAVAAALSAFLPAGLGPLPWSLPSLPDGGWVWADGSVLLADTPHTALRAAYVAAGFPYGQDGSGNPRVPDMRGRVPAGQDDLGGTAANRLTSGGSGVNGATLGAAGGAETHTLTVAQMPAHTHDVRTGNGTASAIRVSSYLSQFSTIDIADAALSKGGGEAHNNTQPTLVVNYIVKA